MRVIQKALTFDDVLLLPAHSRILPRDASLFAVARIAGWAAHYDEEQSERPVRYRGITTRN